MGRCLDSKTLRALAKGELAPDAAEAAEVHIAQCGRCAKALAGLPVHDDLIAELRNLERERAALPQIPAILDEIEKQTTTTLFGKQTL